jgi:hypothetical protein
MFDKGTFSFGPLPQMVSGNQYEKYDASYCSLPHDQGPPFKTLSFEMG